MKGKTLTAIIMVFFLVAALFVSAPVLSGEHPWDVDKSGDIDPGLPDEVADTLASDESLSRSSGGVAWYYYVLDVSSYLLTGQIAGFTTQG